MFFLFLLYRLWYGTDYNGNPCGYNDNIGSISDNCKENGCKYIYYPRLNEDFMASGKSVYNKI